MKVLRVLKKGQKSSRYLLEGGTSILLSNEEAPEIGSDLPVYLESKVDSGKLYKETPAKLTKEVSSELPKTEFKFNPEDYAL